MQNVDNSQSSSEYYCRLYWVHVLIGYNLTTERKYALIEKYALNKHVRLLTRLYGILINNNMVMNVSSMMLHDTCANHE